MAQETQACELKLLQDTIAGRPGAWDTFYQRYIRLIVACLRKVHARYCVPFTSDQMDDLVNTVCLQLIRDDYHKLRAYDHERGYRLSSWVGLIATNVAHDALRRRPPTAVPLDEASEHADTGALSPEQSAMRRNQQQLLNQALQQLTESERLFVRYYYQERQTPEQIADAQGISVNTVYSRKSKVREKLKKIMKERGLS